MIEHTRTIDNALYTRKALAAAREAYSAYCHVRAAPRADGRVDIAVTVKGEYAPDARQVILDFWNYFLDTACQDKLAAA